MFTNGSCYKFYLILKEIYPDAVAYYDSDHIITKIGSMYYDIEGIAAKGRHIPLNDDLDVLNRVIKLKY